MSALNDQKCPNCGQSVSIQMAWEMEPKNRFGLLAYGAGVVCGNCGVKLRIEQSRAKAVSVGLLMLTALLIVTAKVHPGSQESRVLMALALVAVILAMFPRLLIVRFLTLIPSTGDGTVDFPVERLKEQMAERPRAEEKFQAKREAMATAHWVCALCGNANPNVTRICDHCGRDNPGAM